MLYNFIKRLLYHEDDCLIGKIKQFTKYEEKTTEQCPLANQVLPYEIMNNIDISKKAVFRGTVGIIYTGIYDEETVCVKTILTSTKENMKDDIHSFNSIGNVLGVFASNLPKMVNSLCKCISMETNINHEKKMCNVINKILSPNIDIVDFLKPIDDFESIQNVFVYKYVEGVCLLKMSKGDVKTIGRNIALVFFKAIHEYNMIFGDMNPGNFIYNKKTNKITFIDYGCVFELNKTQLNVIKELHRAQQNKIELRNYLKKWNAPILLADNIYDSSRIFWTKDANYTNTGFLDILKIPGVAECKLPSEIVIVIKAVYQLIELEKWLECKCDISDYLKTI